MHNAAIPQPTRDYTRVEMNMVIPAAIALRAAARVSDSDTAVHGVREYNVSGLLADHINRADDEETGYPRKNRCVHDAQPGDVVDPKTVVDHSATLLRPDRAGA